MKVRIKFTKTGVLKFVGHLDFLRLFQKAFRRADIPLAYSQGFNPHQLISIAAPLPIGVTSTGEYMDIELKEHIDKQTAINSLNETLPEGVEIIDWIELEDDSKSGMAIVEIADYTITSNKTFDSSEIVEKLNQFLAQDEILITKKAKKNKMKELNIKEGIYSCVYDASNQQFNMRLATGSKLNIKPEFVLKGFCDFIEENYQPYDYVIHRNEIYTTSENEYLPLG